MVRTENKGPKKPNLRKKIFYLIEPHYFSGRITAYNVIMIAVIIAAIIPIASKNYYPAFRIIDCAAVTAFITDYILRWATADFKQKKKGLRPFFKYPVTNMAIIDFLAFMPLLLSLVNPSLSNSKIIETLKVFSALKALRYMRAKTLAMNVLRKQKKQLLAVCYISLEYILFTALIIFNVEPETFDSFFDAVYWATVSLTTVGYGDIYPVSTIGRIITMFSSFFGIAIIAMPAAFITAGIMQELSANNKDNNGDSSKKN